jgi:hypothetical protein
MTTTGLALFVFFAFLVPVPLLHWLDLARHQRDGTPRDRSAE